MYMPGQIHKAVSNFQKVYAGKVNTLEVEMKFKTICLVF